MSGSNSRLRRFYSVAAVHTLMLKSLRQQRRDPLSLGLTLGTSPFFVAVYRLLYGGDSPVGIDEFVPSLLIFAVIMLIFNTAMAVAREREEKTLARLRRSPMGDGHYLMATGLVQALVGGVSVGLTFLAALALGFEPRGSALAGFGITLVAGMACIGLGLAVASLAASVHRAFLIASASMFLLLLFSGVIFPLPTVEVVNVMGLAVGPLDLLPTVHAVRALQDVLLRGSAVTDLTSEVAAMVTLSLLYFSLGWSIFAGGTAMTSKGV